MIHFENMTADETKWLLDQLPPAPEVIIMVCYRDFSRHKQWKVYSYLSKEQFDAITNWPDRIREGCPSAEAWRIYRLGGEK